MDWANFLRLGEALARAWRPYLDQINAVLLSSDLLNPLVGVPLSLCLVLLLLWMLLRVRRRRITSLPPQIAAKIAAKTEAPEVEVEVETQAARGPAPLVSEAPVVTPEPPMEAPPEPELEPEPEPEPEPEISFFARLKRGLSKTSAGFVGKIDRVLAMRDVIDGDLYEELEEALITADVGVGTAYKLLEGMRELVGKKGLKDPGELRNILKEQVLDILGEDATPLQMDAHTPFVLMVVGVNGVGKTTTIGKLASKFTAEGKTVLMAAGDTFRAAAIEQLEIWSRRAGCDIIKQKPGADPSAVAYDAVQAAKARRSDVVIVDTAGRLHTKTNLMEELKKTKRVMAKIIPDAPHEIILVLDATTGQNAIIQAKTFHEALELTGLILTKLDGTSKGGCIVGIRDELPLPVRFIGIGEKIDDLRPFDPKEFVEAMFER